MTKYVISQKWKIRIKEWMFEKALPLWLTAGFNQKTGLFHESLNFVAEQSEEIIIRGRVQSRQLHVFAQAKKMGFVHEQLDEVLQKAYNTLKQSIIQNKRGGAAYLSIQGEILEQKEVLYDQSFILLALASLSQLDEFPDALDIATQLCTFLDTHMTHTEGEYIEKVGGNHNNLRHQNPYMHLFEAFLALYQVAHKEIYLQKATKIFFLFQNYFFDEKTGRVAEIFTSDWQKATQKQGQRYEAGHHFEWVFLLNQFQTLSEYNTKKQQDALMQWGMKYGLDREKIFALNQYGDKQGKRRLWVQTEFLRALYTRENQTVQVYIERLLSNLFDTYLATKHQGLWHDNYDIHENMIADYVPASTLYHLWGAFIYILDETV